MDKTDTKDGRCGGQTLQRPFFALGAHFFRAKGSDFAPRFK